MNPQEAPKTCSCKCHRVKPIAVILFALSWLFATMGIMSFTWYTVNVIGAILIIIVMIPKLGCCKCCKKQ